jgi:hypothetical protein
MEKVYICIDTEFEDRKFNNVNNRCILSIGACVLDDSGIDNTFQTTVNPEFDIIPSIYHTHTAVDLSQQEPWSVGGIKFWKWVFEKCPEEKQLVFCGYNINGSDINTLLCGFKRYPNVLEYVRTHRPSMGDLRVVDCYAIAKKLVNANVIPKLEPLGQVNVYKYLFGENPINIHQALDDANACRLILKHNLFFKHINECENKALGKNNASWNALLPSQIVVAPKPMRTCIEVGCGKTYAATDSWRVRCYMCYLNINKGSKYDPVPLTERTLGRETCSVE